MQIDAITAREDIRKYGALRVHYDVYGTGPRIGCINIPDFKGNSEGYTKTEPTRSDEEILNDLKELAKKHAEKGRFHNADNEYLDLFKEYISSVSPDREGILTNSLKQLSSEQILVKTDFPKKEKEEPLSILQQTLRIMEQTKNKNKTASNNKIWSSDVCKAGYIEDDPSWNKVRFKLSNGSAEFKIGEGNELKIANFYDSNGEKIAQYTPNGWSLQATNAELTRSREALAVYNEAFNSVYNAQEASRPKSLTSGNSLDVVG